MLALPLIFPYLTAIPPRSAPFLIISTIIWAFSFSIIGNYLSSDIDPWSLSLIRVIISFLIFLPFIDLNINKKRMVYIIGVGAIQIGFMYSFWIPVKSVGLLSSLSDVCLTVG